jgi:hypothetical protein
MAETSHADRVREHARQQYVEPARRRHESTIRIVAGEVQKAVQLSNRVSLVCQALKSHKFLDENRLVLEKWDGPPSGMSTTVIFTYRLLDEGGRTVSQSAASSFLRLRGIAKDVFKSLGGGEEFIRQEREQFYGSEEDR